MPKLKTHHWVGATLSLKNCFGCVPGRVYGWPKNVLHCHGIENSILDIDDAPSDRSSRSSTGSSAWRATARSWGRRSSPACWCSATDPVAVDATAASLMGIDPERVGYLREAGKFLGQTDLDRVEQRGEDVGRNVTHFTPAPGFERLSV